MSHAELLHLFIAFPLIVCFASAAFRLLRKRLGLARFSYVPAWVRSQSWWEPMTQIIETAIIQTGKNGVIQLQDIIVQEVVMQGNIASVCQRRNTFQGILLQQSQWANFFIFQGSGIAPLSKNFAESESVLYTVIAASQTRQVYRWQV